MTCLFLSGLFSVCYSSYLPPVPLHLANNSMNEVWCSSHGLYCYFGCIITFSATLRHRHPVTTITLMFHTVNMQEGKLRLSFSNLPQVTLSKSGGECHSLLLSLPFLSSCAISRCSATLVYAFPLSTEGPSHFLLGVDFGLLSIG